MLFWMLAAMKVIFSARIQIRSARHRSAFNLALSKSQRTDDWLGLALMVVVLKFDGSLPGWLNHQVRELVAAIGADPAGVSMAVYLAGLVLISWLAMRSRQRIRLLES